DEVEAFGPAAEEVGLGLKLGAHGVGGGADDAHESRVTPAQLAVRGEHDREVAAQLGGAGAGEERDARAALREGVGALVQSVEVERLVKERVGDETGADAAALEPLLLEGEEAEHKIGAAAEFADAPGAPCPELRGDE